MLSDFHTTTHGKWILAGEHAVLRSGGALVFPVKEKTLTLDFYPNSSPLRASYHGKCGEDMHLLFWNVLDHGLHLLNKTRDGLQGDFELSNTIPIGVGLGASGALCVAMARWFAAQSFINSSEIHAFAKQLENLFHGQSSGLDLAGAAAQTGLYFKGGDMIPLRMVWSPTWYLTPCGQVGITANCIRQVQHLLDDRPAFAAAVDETMQACVEEARFVLEHTVPDAKERLAQAVNQAATCFASWGLMSERLQQHRQDLIARGAIATKPTGSGGEVLC